MAVHIKKAPDAPHVLSWRKNIKEIDRLLDIHTQLTGKGAGRRRDVQVLNKSSVILLLVCWESYIEDLAGNAFEFLLQNADSPAVLPDFVLAIAAKELKNGDTSEIWKLAGEGWKDALTTHKEKILSKYILKGSFNTPNADNINKLMAELVGMTSVSREWYWRNVKNQLVLSKLESFIELRGEIAHRVESSKPVLKKDVIMYRSLICRLATITNNRLAVYIYSRTKLRAWRRYKYGNTR